MAIDLYSQLLESLMVSPTRLWAAKQHVGLYKPAYSSLHSPLDKVSLTYTLQRGLLSHRIALHMQFANLFSRDKPRRFKVEESGHLESNDVLRTSLPGKIHVPKLALPQ